MSEVETELGDELDELAASMLRGEVVPLLGAGVNLCGRPADFTWIPRDSCLPDGGELATYLAKEFKAPDELARTKDLIRVSQFIDSVKNSGGRLAGELHDIFDADGLEPGPMHLFLAKAATIVREQGRLRQIPVILTTNYDYLLERAFEQAGEPYDLITYVATSPKEHVGRFMHSAPGKPPQPIENASGLPPRAAGDADGDRQAPRPRRAARVDELEESRTRRRTTTSSPRTTTSTT